MQVDARAIRLVRALKAYGYGENPDSVRLTLQYRETSVVLQINSSGSQWVGATVEECVAAGDKWVREQAAHRVKTARNELDETMAMQRAVEEVLT